MMIFLLNNEVNPKYCAVGSDYASSFPRFPVAGDFPDFPLEKMAGNHLVSLAAVKDFSTSFSRDPTGGRGGLGREGGKSNDKN